MTALVPYTNGSRRSNKAWEPIDGRLHRSHVDILKFIRKRKKGATCDQVEAGLNRIHQTVSARINELVNWGYLFDTGNKRITRSGHKARVLRCEWPTKKTAKQMLLLKEGSGEEKASGSRSG